MAASSNEEQDWRLAAKDIVAVAVLLLHAFGREGIPPFPRNRAHSQIGSVTPRSHSEADRTACLARKIISPPESILLSFFRLSRGPDLTRVGPALQ
jgi:hypothetical protein